MVTPKVYLLALYVWLFGLIRGYSLQNIYTLMRQAMLETSWGKNPLFIEGNNAFGMRVPSWSPFKPQEFLNHAGYKHLYQSVWDRMSWDKRFNIPIQADRTIYLNAIQSRGYATSQNYIQTIHNIVSIDTITSAVGLAVPGVIFVYWLFK